MLDFKRERRPRLGLGWLASVGLHAAVAALVFVVSWRVVPHITFINLPAPQAVSMPGLPAAGGAGGKGAAGLGAHAAQAKPTAVQAPIATPESVSAQHTTVALGAPGPKLGDSRLWAAPRPALPGEVAQELYAPHDAADSVVVRRLRAMVDSLNRIIDVEQAAHRMPSWTTEVSGKKFGLDSSGIYVAGIKIPTAVLAALGNSLPPGNFDASLRQRQLDEMRADLLQAAQRTATLEDFRRYVKEIRARKQSERDAARRARGDTTSSHADTTPLVP